jgi:hypothetical protein
MFSVFPLSQVGPAAFCLLTRKALFQVPLLRQVLERVELLVLTVESMGFRELLFIAGQHQLARA